MPNVSRIVAPVLILVLCLSVPALAAGGPGGPTASAGKVLRWESNLSLGSVSNGRLGIVKSFWWYALPRVVALGLSLDHVLEAVPFSLNVALNAPTPVVVPFVCAGVGTTLTSGGISFYGGGLKIRLGRRFGLVAEYRKYAYKQTDGSYDPTFTKATAGYFGGGIAYIY